MVELVTYIVNNFVEDTTKFAVEEHKTSDDTVQITVKLTGDDMGKVIGKQGKIAKAIRTIVKAASARENVKYLVEITEM